MTIYTYSQLEQLWIQAGGPIALAPLMAAIGKAESGGNEAAMNYTDNGGTQTSVGIWQVSNGTHQFPQSWTTALGNAQEAVSKYRSPQGLSAWGTYVSGAYKKFYKGGVNPSSLPQGGGGGNTPIPTTNTSISSDVINSILGGLDLPNLGDLFKRLGLILLGGMLVIVGVVILAGKPAVKIGVDAVKSGMV